MNTTSLNFIDYDAGQTILSKEQLETNGRINIKEPMQDDWFSMQERIAVKATVSEYREALTGDMEDSRLSKAFFSAENIQIIQNGLRAGVYAMSNKEIVVPPQNVDNIKIVMRSVFMQHAEHNVKDIPGQIERLNKVVLNYAVKDVYGAAVSYLKYIEDQSTLVTPIALPTQVDRDYKHLEQRSFL